MQKLYLSMFSDIAETMAEGKVVFWKNIAYKVIRCGEEYGVLCTNNDNYVGLYTPDYNPNDFFYIEQQEKQNE